MSSRHNVQSGNGQIVWMPGRGTFYGWPGRTGEFTAATGVPVNGTVGFAPGCIFQNVLASAIPFLYINIGTFASSNWVPFDTNQVSNQGFIPLPLDRWRLMVSNDIATIATYSGGITANNSNLFLKRVNTLTDECFQLGFLVNSSAFTAALNFQYPPDLDATKPVVFNVQAAMAGVVDTPALTLTYFEGKGDTNRGGTLGNITGTTTTTYSRSIQPTAGFPASAEVGLTPDSHTTNQLLIYSTWVSYTKKPLAT